jgi:tripartite-type tricarboxylate transporter receptor subunit TctC
VLADPGIRDFLTRSGIDPEGGSPEELTRYMRSELAKWTKAVKAANIKLD